MRILTSLKQWCFFCFFLRQFVFGAFEIKKATTLKIFCSTELWRCFVLNTKIKCFKFFPFYKSVVAAVKLCVCVFWKIFCLFFHEKWNLWISVFSDHMIFIWDRWSIDLKKKIFLIIIVSFINHFKNSFIK